MIKTEDTQLYGVYCKWTSNKLYIDYNYMMLPNKESLYKWGKYAMFKLEEGWIRSPIK